MRTQLTELRNKMKELGIDVYVVSDKDEHLSEYTDAHFGALAEFSGFTGGDGTLIVSQDKAALWTDGRYFIQAEQELEGSGIELMRIGEPGTPAQSRWIAMNMPNPGKLAFDGKCTSFMDGFMLKRELKPPKHNCASCASKSCSSGDSSSGCSSCDNEADKLGQVTETGIDVCGLVWKDRPAETCNPVWVLDEKYCGKPASIKLAELKNTVRKFGGKTHIISALDDIAWLLNLRGNDIPYNPVFMAYMIIRPDAEVKTNVMKLAAVNDKAGQASTMTAASASVASAKNVVKAAQASVTLYSDERHFNDDVKAYLAGLGVELRPYEDIFDDVSLVESPVMMDRRRCSYELVNSLPRGARILDRMNPTMSDKCRKNDIEAKNIAIAQHADSLAVTRFYKWFKTEALPAIRAADGAGADGKQIADNMNAGADGKQIADNMNAAADVQQTGRSINSGKITEWSCAEKLHEFRAQCPHFIEESFSTISAYAANASMAHYMPSAEREVAIEPRGLYLVDSGGQYYEGTTDITRTWSCGPTTEEERRAFTFAVMGNLRLADARFLDGISNFVLDYAAREPFWRHGMNYNHGTGHGVGHVLNVHEGPVGIRYKSASMEGAWPMNEGMYVSDEPAYYKEGAFGVRMENMLLSVKDYENEYGTFLRFRTCSWVPMDKDCLEIGLMTAEDIHLWNEYHEGVYRELAADMSDEERAWLAEVCAPIG